jgi:hypothetical protein
VLGGGYRSARVDDRPRAAHIVMECGVATLVTVLLVPSTRLDAAGVLAIVVQAVLAPAFDRSIASGLLAGSTT